MSQTQVDVYCTTERADNPTAGMLECTACGPITVVDLELLNALAASQRLLAVAEAHLKTEHTDKETADGR